MSMHGLHKMSNVNEHCILCNVGCMWHIKFLMDNAMLTNWSCIQMDYVQCAILEIISYFAIQCKTLSKFERSLQ